MTGRLSLLKKVVSKGFSLNSKNGFGEGVLHFSVRKRALDIFDWCCSNGCDKDDRDKFGKTPLFVLLSDLSVQTVDEASTIRFVKDLLSRGIDVSRRDWVGNTAMEMLRKSPSAKICGLSPPVMSLLSLLEGRMMGSGSLKSCAIVGRTL